MKPHNKGLMYVWCAGYWENGKFIVPRNLYHLKLYSENSFKFLFDLSRVSGKDWKIISERARNELTNDGKLMKTYGIREGEIFNSNSETTWEFEF